MNRVLATIECAPATSEQLMPATDAEALAGLLKALADPVRLRLLRLVAESPDTTACACHMPTALGISQPTLSHHLRKLVDAGLLVREQRGRWAHYRLVGQTLGPVRGYLDACR
ncbi:MAG: ArsR/SmtB family transcription factor [Propionicimonas sp.]